ncbi:MAG: glycosyl hydrolase family 28-related protein [Armatimonadota bacterium]
MNINAIFLFLLTTFVVCLNALAIELNVMDFGAKADGITDDTDAFNNALQEAAKTHGSTVHAPAGKYHIAGKVVVPFYTTLKGDYLGPGKYEDGTILLATGFKGMDDGGKCCLATAGRATIRGY